MKDHIFKYESECTDRDWEEILYRLESREREQERSSEINTGLTDTPITQEDEEAK
jgi:hypothetical protein